MNRIITFDYHKVNTAELGAWLKKNDYRFELIHANDTCYENGTDTVGTTMIDLILYSEEAETAVRLKWSIGDV